MPLLLIFWLLLKSPLAFAQEEPFTDPLDTCLQKMAVKSLDAATFCDLSLQELTKSPFTEQTSQLFQELLRKLKEQNVPLVQQKWGLLQATMTGGNRKTPTLLEKREFSVLLKELQSNTTDFSMLKNGQPIALGSLPAEAATLAQWNLSANKRLSFTQVETLNQFMKLSLAELKEKSSFPVSPPKNSSVERPGWIWPVVIVSSLLLGAYLLRDKQISVTW